MAVVQICMAAVCALLFTRYRALRCTLPRWNIQDKGEEKKKKIWFWRGYRGNYLQNRFI